MLPFFTGMVESAIFSGIVNERIFLTYEFADHTYKSEALEPSSSPICWRQ